MGINRRIGLVLEVVRGDGGGDNIDGSGGESQS